MTKRVLYVLDKSGFGGVQSIAATLYQHKLPDVELSFFFLRNINPLYGLADLQGQAAVYSTTRAKYNPWSFVELCRLIRVRKIDILHLNGNKSAVYGVLAKKLFPRLKIINHDHSGEFDYGGWFARFLKFAAPHIDCFLCVSGRRQGYLVEQCGVPRAKTVVLNNFVDERRFTWQERVSDPTRKRSFVIGFVGRLSRVKGCDVLIQALPTLCEKIPELEVHIVGAGPDRLKLEALSRQLGVAAQVKFLGFMANPAAAYAVFDLMVIPSRAEEGPICLYEAWLMKVPVVASDAPVIDTRIRDGETGLLFPSEKADALAANVLKLYNDRDLRKELIGNGLKAVQELTAEKYVARLREVYLFLV